MLKSHTAKVFHLALFALSTNLSTGICGLHTTTHKNLTKKPDKKKALESNPDLLALQEEFLQIFGTKVSISGNMKKGVVKIFYYSPDELGRIYEKAKGGHS